MRARLPAVAGHHGTECKPPLLIAEFARRHIAREAGWGRIIGLTSGGEMGFPEEVSYGAAKAAALNTANVITLR